MSNKVVKIMGDGRFEEVKAGKMAVTDNVDFNGDITGGSLKVSGSAKVRGKLES